MSCGKNKKPNILLFMTDQHRYECLSCHGHPVVKTPNIDRLACDGVDFQQTYAQVPICMPSRISLFTGQYAHVHGILSNSSTVDVSDLTMLPEFLKEHSYQTAAIGKNHAGHHEDVGFEYVRWCDGLNEGETNHYLEYLWQKGILKQGETSFPDEDVAVKAYDAYVSKVPYEHTNEAWTGRESVEYLKNKDPDKPFFLWSSFERPHPPTSVPKDNPFPYAPDDIELPQYDLSWYSKPGTKRAGCENMWNVFNTGQEKLRQAMANYFTLISMIDDQVGTIVKQLEQNNELENTLIIFTSDHGDFCGEFGQFGKGAGAFDVLHRVPLIFYQKGVTGKEQIHELTELVDVMPTILDMAGIAVPRTVQGQSLSAVIKGSIYRGGEPWEGKEAVFFETPFVKTVRTKTHKLSWCYKGSSRWGQLYDMLKDPGEKHNLFNDPAYDRVQRGLERRLLNWFIQTQQLKTHGCGIDETPPPWRWYQE